MMTRGNRGAELPRRTSRPGTAPPTLVGMTAVPDAYWADAARHLARLPGVVAGLLDRHVAGPDGRCRECRSHARGAPIWPCDLALLARRAAAAD